MHILFTNNTLDRLAGTELYVYDLAKEYRRRGLTVTCFTPQPGLVAERLRELGVAVVSDLADVPDGATVIHAHHNLEARLVAARLPMTPLVFVSHGMVHALERPGEAAAFVTRFVAVSEQVRRCLIQQDGVPRRLVDVVPNFVDVGRFKARNPIAPHPRRVLVISNRFGEGTSRLTVERACELAGGLELRAIGSLTGSVWNVEDYIEWADVVVTLGRGALQAMAMGRAVVVYDYRGGDGLVTPANYAELSRTNFNAHGHLYQYTPEQLSAEILRYKHREVESLAEIVRERYSVALAADRLIDLYDRASREFIIAWPPEHERLRLRSTLRALADYLALSRETNRRLAALENTAQLYAERDQEMKRLFDEATWQAARIRELESALALAQPEVAGWLATSARLEAENGELRARVRSLETRGHPLEVEVVLSGLLRRIAAGRAMRTIYVVGRLLARPRLRTGQ